MLTSPKASPKQILNPFAFAFIVLAALSSQLAFAVPLNLGVGQQEALTFESLAKSVNVEKSGVVDITKGETKSIIILTGKNEGVTKVTIRLEDSKVVIYDVNVSKNSKNSLTNLLQRLRKAPGISIEQQGGKFIVAGQFRSRSDQLHLQNAVREFPGLIVDTTDPEIVESNAVVKAINRVLADNDLSNLQAHAYGQIIALEGSPKSEAQKALALRIARIISPGIEDHVATDSNGAPPIAIEVLFIESGKSNKKAYGINGPQDAFAGGTTKGTGIAGGGISGLNATRQLKRHTLDWHVGNLSAFLRLEQSKGSSRIVSNPKLIARSGQKADFESGGAFYIPQEVVGTDGRATKTYIQQQTGISLSIEPRIDAIGQIDSRIKTTIVDIGEKSDTDAPPSLIKSNLETAVTIPSGQSILLSGLTLKRAKKTVSRVPLLADIPLIGELFKSREQQFEDREVAVIVTMKRVAPSETRAQVADQLLDTSDDDVSFSFFD
jgi:Flp pilus assembly secretin CpaC